ncbi:flavin reductase family protein [Amorphus sp. 3PC139-8]
MTTMVDDRRSGLVATSVISVSADPASLLVCTNHATSAHDAIDRAGMFCVNILGEGDEEIAAQFSSSQRRDERFLTGNWQVGPGGMPVLGTALAWFECAVEVRLAHHSHTIFIARPTTIDLGSPGRPLVYYDQTFL